MPINAILFHMQKLIYVPICLALVTPFLLSGSFSGYSILAVLLFTLLSFLIFSRMGAKIALTTPNKTFVIFTALIILLIPFSMLPICSVSSVIWWVVYLGIFLSFQGIVRDERLLKWMSGMFVALTAIFGIMSIVSFIHVGLISYTRLDGIIGGHNVYGGFLLIPFLLSLYFSLKKNPIWQKILWIISSAVIFSSIILTFSRGTWFSLVVALTASFFLFRTCISAALKNVFIGRSFSFKNPSVIAGTLIVVTLIMTGSIWLVAKHTATVNARNNPGGTNTVTNAAVFSNEDSDNNAFTARLHYFSDAFQTFIHSPIIGFGAGTYANALRMYKTDPNYGSFGDPHNWLLRMMVEDGIIAALIFLVFLGSFFCQVWKSIIRLLQTEPARNSWLIMAIFTGLIASTLHGLMDFDWSYNLVLLIFFCFTGALYGVSQVSRVDGDTERESVKVLPRWTNYLFMMILFVAIIVSFQIFRADSARAIGDYDMATRRSQKDTINNIVAIGDYQESARLNPFEPLTWYDMWSATYQMGDYKAARVSIEKAIALSPLNGIYYSALVATDEAEKDYSGYESHLLAAVKYFPAADLTNELRLAQYYFTNKKYDLALAVINKVLPIYTHYQSVLWYSSDPNSPTMSANLKKLNALKAKIEEII